MPALQRSRKVVHSASLRRQEKQKRIHVELMVELFEEISVFRECQLVALL
jgi:hypothetical protein